MESYGISEAFLTGVTVAVGHLLLYLSGTYSYLPYSLNPASPLFYGKLLQRGTDGAQRKKDQTRSVYYPSSSYIQVLIKSSQFFVKSLRPRNGKNTCDSKPVSTRGSSPSKSNPVRVLVRERTTRVHILCTCDYGKARRCGHSL